MEVAATTHKLCILLRRSLDMEARSSPCMFLRPFWGLYGMALCQGAAVVRGERSGTMISALIACSRARLSLVVEELGAVVGRGTTWRAAATGGRVDDTKFPPVLVPPLCCQSLHEVGD